MMPLPAANQSQLIRSSQKDDYYQSTLRNNANEAFQTLAGSKRWLDWRREIELLSDLGYYGLTTFSGYQTLGEEYVHVVQVDPSKHQIPSQPRRGLSVLCHAFLPYLLEKVLVCLENELDGGQQSHSSNQQQAVYGLLSLELWMRKWVQRAAGMLSESQRRACLSALFIIKQCVTLLHHLHVALFYVNGSFYHLSKRTAGISYVHVVRLSEDSGSIRSHYRLLGAVSLLQLLITTCLHVNNFRQRQRSQQEWKLYRNLMHTTRNSPQHTQTSSPRAARCILCLEGRRHSTSTPCGHLFCWECITEWCSTKAECPLCREKFQPHRLVYLRNYS